jgi:hypothetical protein
MNDLARKIIEAMGSCHSLMATAEVCGCSKAWAHKVISTHAPHLLQMPKPAIRAKEDAVMAEYRSGLSLRAVSAKLGIPRATIQGIIRRISPDEMRKPNPKKEASDGDRTTRGARTSAKDAKAKKPAPTQKRTVPPHKKGGAVKAVVVRNDAPPASSGNDHLFRKAVSPSRKSDRKGGWNDGGLNIKKGVSTLSDDDAIRLFILSKGVTKCPPSFCAPSQIGDFTR